MALLDPRVTKSVRPSCVFAIVRASVVGVGVVGFRAGGIASVGWKRKGARI